MVVDQPADSWDLIVAKEVLIEVNLAKVCAARKSRYNALRFRHTQQNSTSEVCQRSAHRELDRCMIAGLQGCDVTRL